MKGAPVLPYGIARKHRWSAAVYTIVVMSAFGSVLCWRHREEIRQWNDDRRERAEIRSEFQQNIERGMTAISSAHWQEAQIDLDKARLAAGANPTLFRIEERQTFNDKFYDADVRLEQAQAQYQRQHPAPRGLKLRYGCVFNGTNVIRDLNNTAERLICAGDYDEARTLAEQVLTLDPHNSRALVSYQEATAHLSFACETQPVADRVPTSQQ